MQGTGSPGPGLRNTGIVNTLPHFIGLLLGLWAVVTLVRLPTWKQNRSCPVSGRKLFEPHMVVRWAVWPQKKTYGKRFQALVGLQSHVDLHAKITLLLSMTHLRPCFCVFLNNLVRIVCVWCFYMCVCVFDVASLAGRRCKLHWVKSSQSPSLTVRAFMYVFDVLYAYIKFCGQRQFYEVLFSMFTMKSETSGMFIIQ